MMTIFFINHDNQKGRSVMNDQRILAIKVIKVIKESCNVIGTNNRTRLVAKLVEIISNKVSTQQNKILFFTFELGIAFLRI
jgi:hypothetical protein